ncbi:MAG: Trm112 family protein [Gammaproteobacteria bacterium]
MDRKFFDIVVCPVTKLPLERLDDQRLDQMTPSLAPGRVRNQADQQVNQAVAEALIRRDGHVVYPIIDGRPRLLEGESIDWNQVVE